MPDIFNHHRLLRLCRSARQIFCRIPGHRNSTDVLSAKKHVGAFQSTEEVWQAWEITREISEALQARFIVFQCPASFEPSTENQTNLRNNANMLQDARRFMARIHATASTKQSATRIKNIYG